MEGWWLIAGSTSPEQRKTKAKGPRMTEVYCCAGMESMLACGDTPPVIQDKADGTSWLTGVSSPQYELQCLVCL